MKTAQSALLGLLVVVSACSGRSESPSGKPKGAAPARPPVGPARTSPPAARAVPPRFDLLRGLMPSTLAVRFAEGLTDADQKIISVHCPFGRPLKDRNASHGETVFVVRIGYVLLHSSRRKTPLWVCEAVQKKQLLGDVSRQGLRIDADPKLLQYPRAELKDYKRVGYHRGRMASCANQNSDAKLKAERLKLSNVAPMKPEFRTGVWRDLELKIQGWIKARGYARIITGPFLYAGKDAGLTEYLFIGPGKVIVPTHFYKIVVAPDRRGRVQAIGFVLENRPYEKPYPWPSFVKSIDWIEKHTGFDFMPELNGADERRLERKPARMW